jgi:hypothetical protein
MAGSTVADATGTISSPLCHALKETAKFNRPLTRQSNYKTEVVSPSSILASEF